MGDEIVAWAFKQLSAGMTASGAVLRDILEAVVAKAEKRERRAWAEAVGAYWETCGPQCDERGCYKLATMSHVDIDGRWYHCDEHRKLGASDRGDAAPIRALLALMERS